MKQLLAGSLTCYYSDSGRLVSQPLEEGQADVLLHPLPFLQHAQNVLLRCQGKTLPCIFLFFSYLFSSEPLISVSCPHILKFLFCLFSCDFMIFFFVLAEYNVFISLGTVEDKDEGFKLMKDILNLLCSVQAHTLTHTTN